MAGESVKVLSVQVSKNKIGEWSNGIRSAKGIINQYLPGKNEKSLLKAEVGRKAKAFNHSIQLDQKENSSY